MGFFSAIFNVGKKLAVPLYNLGKKIATPVASLGKKIGSNIGQGFNRIRNLFRTPPKNTNLTTPLLGEIPNPSQIDKIVKLGQVMPVKQSWLAVRESGKAIGGVSKRGAGGLTKAQRIAKETNRINKMGKQLNQAEFFDDFLTI
jgi:hypothetical protein